MDDSAENILGRDRLKSGLSLHVFFRNHRQFSLALTALVFLLGVVGILNHAMWRDELNAWLVARDSSSVFELFANIKYEGHPGLWYLCLALISRVSHNPLGMQIFHVLLGTISTYFFVTRSPFLRWQKVLFVLGYLPIYEYLVISRNYAIGLLTIILFCVQYPQREKNYIPLALLLFLMSNCNAYCLFIAISLGITLVLELILGKKINYQSTATLRNKLISFSIFLLGIVTAFAQLIPPTDSRLQGGLRLNLQFDLRHFLTAITRLWNSYILILVPGDSKYWSVIIFAILAIVLFLFWVLVFLKKPIACFFYIFATTEILAFTYAKFLGSPRHYGHLYLVLIMSLWLSVYYAPSNLFMRVLTQLPKRIRQRLLDAIAFTRRYQKVLFAAILSAQLIAGIVAYTRNLVVPYSASRATAQFIQKEHLEHLFMVGSPDLVMAPLCGYLQRQIYYPESKKMGSFVLFNNNRMEVSVDEVLRQVRDLLRERQSDILLILNSELDRSPTDLQILPLAQFTEALIYNEKYYLYRVVTQVKS